MDEEYDTTHIFKSTSSQPLVVLVGDASVGKTFLLNRYIKNTVPKNPNPTIGVEFASKVVKLRGEVCVKTQLWDTAGQEKYRAMTAAHYRKSMGALIVYDITKRITFESIPKWLKELQANAEPDIVVMLVGNKVDICNDDASARQVAKEEARSFAAQEGILFEETSAVQSINVKSAFETLMESKCAAVSRNLRKHRWSQ
eukprot:TRINITY_DN962_c0_g4_i2.p1 TRINITY_DN962_c0_g4~~TRINITY_DN962_c0_g4_i2.p1  ORF type:complete len:199 (-),score=55.75 TRINITY_DN962_c0_g4_i2:140-736(-)